MASEYNVTGQRQTTIIGDNGNLQQVVEVSFSVPDIGFKGHVDIPTSRFTKDNVKAAIEAAVSTHTDIANL